MIKFRFIFLFLSHLVFCQEEEPKQKKWDFSSEVVLGKTMEANYNFPDRDLFKGLFVSIGKKSDESSTLKNVLGISKTGILFGASDYGNSSLLGQSYTIIPFFEKPLINLFEQPLILQMGLGASYQNKTYHPISNEFNKGISRPLTWSFRLAFYQEIYQQTSLGVGFYHQSNGHTKFPNQGVNSFFGGVKYDFQKNNISPKEKTSTSSHHNFWTITPRYGYGLNTMSIEHNNVKPVHVLALEFAKTYKQSYKIGFGAYYRFYQHYYDYINDRGEIAVNEHSELLNSPALSASNFGINGSFEIFLNHFGAFFDLGINLYKPAYVVDWKLHQLVFNGYEFVPKDLDSYYSLKKIISTRLGLKYYLFKPQENPLHNLFISASINANLGQADFSEISLGYTRRLNF